MKGKLKITLTIEADFDYDREISVADISPQFRSDLGLILGRRIATDRATRCFVIEKIDVKSVRVTKKIPKP